MHLPTTRDWLPERLLLDFGDTSTCMPEADNGSGCVPNAITPMAILNSGVGECSSWEVAVIRLGLMPSWMCC
jgi:hypothetical protein